jgi:hypothetical protein
VSTFGVADGATFFGSIGPSNSETYKCAFAEAICPSDTFAVNFPDAYANY